MENSNLYPIDLLRQVFCCLRMAAVGRVETVMCLKKTVLPELELTQVAFAHHSFPILCGLSISAFTKTPLLTLRSSFQNKDRRVIMFSIEYTHKRAKLFRIELSFLMITIITGAVLIAIFFFSVLSTLRILS